MAPPPVPRNKTHIRKHVVHLDRCPCGRDPADAALTKGEDGERHTIGVSTDRTDPQGAGTVVSDPHGGDGGSGRRDSLTGDPGQDCEDSFAVSGTQHETTDTTLTDGWADTTVRTWRRF